MKTEEQTTKEPSLIAGEHDMDYYLYEYDSKKGDIDRSKPLFPWTCKRTHHGESEVCNRTYNFPLNFICEKDKVVFIHSFTDPDWSKQKKDNPKYYPVDWSHGRLNIETMEMERVPINRDGKKWDYSAKDYPFAVAEKDSDVYNATLQEISKFRDKTAKQVRDHHEKMEKVFERIDKKEQKEIEPTKK